MGIIYSIQYFIIIYLHLSIFFLTFAEFRIHSLSLSIISLEPNRFKSKKRKKEREIERKIFKLKFIKKKNQIIQHIFKDKKEIENLRKKQ